MRRDPLVAALVAAVFGVLWSQWAAMGVAGIAEAAVRVLGLVIGGALVGTAVVRLRRLGDARTARSMFRSRRYVGDRCRGTLPLCISSAGGNRQARRHMTWL